MVHPAGSMARPVSSATYQQERKKKKELPNMDYLIHAQLRKGFACIVICCAASRQRPFTLNSRLCIKPKSCQSFMVINGLTQFLLIYCPPYF
jgi:hypothetical protein